MNSKSTANCNSPKIFPTSMPTVLLTPTVILSAAIVLISQTSKILNPLFFSPSTSLFPQILLLPLSPLSLLPLSPQKVGHPMSYLCTWTSCSSTESRVIFQNPLSSRLIFFIPPSPSCLNFFLFFPKNIKFINIVLA